MNSTMFAALGEPSRLQIVELLRERPFGVNDLAAALGLRQPQTSKHLRVLRDAGIVEVEQVARRRIHHLRPDAFAEIGDWADSFEATWAARMDSLDTYLNQSQEGSP